MQMFTITLEKHFIKYLNDEFYKVELYDSKKFVTFDRLDLAIKILFIQIEHFIII